MAARFAVTTGNWSGAIWAATSGGAAGSAAVPTSADAVTINKNVTVTIDNTSAVCQSLAASVGTTSGDTGGKLVASTSASSKLTIENGGTLSGSTGSSGAYSSTFEIDLSSQPTLTCEIVINNANGGSGTVSTLRVDGNFIIKGAQKKRHCITSGALTANSSTSVVVSDATGWTVGDQLIFATTSTYSNPPKIDAVTIATITPGAGTTATITWTDGLGTGGAVQYDHASGCPVGNFTSNVVFRPGTANGFATLRISPSLNVNNIDCGIQDVEFRQMKTSAGGNLYTLIGSTRVTSLKRIAFNRFTLVAFYQQNDGASPGDREDLIFYSPQTASELSSSGFWSATAGGYTPDNDVNWVLFGGGGGFRCPVPGQKLIGAKVSGTVIGASSGQAGASNYTIIENSEFWSCLTGILTGDMTCENLRFGSAVFSGAENSVAMYVLPGVLTGKNFNLQSSNNISGIANKNIIGELRLLNRDDDLAIQEVYKRHSNTVPVLQRDASPPTSGGNPQSTSAMLFTLNTTSQADWTFDVLIKKNETVNIFTRARKSGTPSYGSSTLPTLAVYSAGTLVTSSTMSGATAADTWETLSVSATNSGSTDALFQVVVSAQSATAGAQAWFAGLPAAPFVSRCRWYGYRFNETLATRDVDPSSGLYLSTPVTESTAASYTGISISWDVTQSDITLSSNHTFQELYDYHQATALANVGDMVGLTAAGVAGSVSLFAQGDVTVNTGFKLTGNGSISMDTFTFTSEFSSGNTYTYTGGIYANTGSFHSFTGGTLNIGDTGTYSFGLSEAILTFTPTGTGTYALGSSTFSGTIDLRNNTAFAITVQLPSGTLYTTANNTGGTITVSTPTVTQGITFTGVVNGTQVKIFDTGTTTELYSSTSSPYSFSQTYAGDIDVDYTIMKVGYLPIRVTGVTLSTSVQTIPVSQIEDRAYVASSGLTFGTTATVDTTLKQVTVGASTTVQNWYSFMIESWIAETSLKNKAFPFTTNGPNSFSLNNAWVWGDGATSIAFLSRDGMRYVDASGNVTAMWAAILTSGTAAGLQVRYQQTDGGTTVDAANTGAMDQLVQILSDPNGDGSYGDGYDYRSHLVLKIQKDGYDQAEADIYATYGQLEDQLYVAGLNPISNGLTTGNPSVTGITITDHGASPVTWNSKSFSITITDSASPHTGTEIMRWLRYNFGLGGTFQGTDAFNWHDLVQTNGDKFKTVRGSLYGDTGATLKGVMVVKNDGSTAHADFNLFTADDGTTYATPLLQKVTISGAVAGSRIQLYDLTSSTELYNGTPTFPYTWEDTVAASASREVRLRVTYVSGTTAKEMIESTIGTCGITTADYAITYTVNQVNDSVYINNAVDGSLVSNITIDDSTNLVKIAISAGESNWPDIYAYQVYWLNTATGIQDDFAFIQAIDSANYVLTSFLIKNTSSPVVPLTIINGYGKDSVTGLSATLVDTTGGNIYFAPDHVVPYGAGAGLTAAQVWGFDITTVSGTGEAGKKLNDLSAGADPWASDMSSYTTPGTFGAFVQKLLTVAKFLGLK